MEPAVIAIRFGVGVHFSRSCSSGMRAWRPGAIRGLRPLLTAGNAAFFMPWHAIFNGSPSEEAARPAGFRSAGCPVRQPRLGLPPSLGGEGCSAHTDCNPEASMASSLHTCASTTITTPSRVIRRIGPNVIAICSDDAAPVANPKRGGHRKWPPCVSWIWSRPRICPGDFAEMTGDCVPANAGKLVQIIRLAAVHNGELRWIVRGVHQPLALIDPATGAVDEFRREAPAADANLRRCRKP